MADERPPPMFSQRGGFRAKKETSKERPIEKAAVTDEDDGFIAPPMFSAQSSNASSSSFRSFSSRNIDATKSPSANIKGDADSKTRKLSRKSSVRRILITSANAELINRLLAKAVDDFQLNLAEQCNRIFRESESKFGERCSAASSGMWQSAIQSGASNMALFTNLSSAGNITAVLRHLIDIMPQDETDFLSQEVSAFGKKSGDKKKMSYAKFVKHIQGYKTTDLDMGALIDLACKTALFDRIHACCVAALNASATAIADEESEPLIKACFAQLRKASPSMLPRELMVPIVRRVNRLCLGILGILSLPEFGASTSIATHYQRQLQFAVRGRDAIAVARIFETMEHICLSECPRNVFVDLLRTQLKPFRNPATNSKSKNSFRTSKDLDLEIYSLIVPRRALVRATTSIVSQINCCEFNRSSNLTGSKLALVDLLSQILDAAKALHPVKKPHKDALFARDCELLMASIAARMPRASYDDAMSTLKMRLASKQMLSNDKATNTLRCIIALLRGPDHFPYENNAVDRRVHLKPVAACLVANGISEDGYLLREPQIVSWAIQKVLDLQTVNAWSASATIKIGARVVLAVGTNVVGSLDESGTADEATVRTVRAASGGMMHLFQQLLDVQRHSSAAASRLALRAARLALDQRSGFLDNACGKAAVSLANRSVSRDALVSTLVRRTERAAEIAIALAARSFASEASKTRLSITEKTLSENEDSRCSARSTALRFCEADAFADIDRSAILDNTTKRHWLEVVMEILAATDQLTERWCCEKLVPLIVSGRVLMHPMLREAAMRAMRSVVRRSIHCGDMFLALLGCAGKTLSVQMRDPRHAAILLSCCRRMLELWKQQWCGDGEAPSTTMTSASRSLFAESKSNDGIDWLLHVEAAATMNLAARLADTRCAAFDLLVTCAAVRDATTSKSVSVFDSKSGGAAYGHVVSRARARFVLEEHGGAQRLRQILIVSPNHGDLRQLLPTLRESLHDEKLLPFVLAEFALVAIRLCPDVAYCVRVALRDHIVGSSDRCTLATSTVINDFGSVNAPHVISEWCNAHVLFHALCSDPSDASTRKDFKDSVLSILGAMEQVASTSRGRAMKWLGPRVCMMFQAVNVKFLSNLLEALWKWYSHLMRKKQKVARPLLMHIWHIIRAVSQHPQLLHEARCGRAEATGVVLCDIIADPFFIFDSQWAAPSSTKIASMPMERRAAWLMQPLRLIYEVTHLVSESNGYLKTWPTATRRRIFEWLRAAHDWPLKKADTSSALVMTFVNLVFRTAAKLSQHGRLLRDEQVDNLRRSLEKQRTARANDETTISPTSEFGWWLAAESSGFACLRNLIAFHPDPMFDLCCENVYTREYKEACLFYHALLDQLLPSPNPMPPTQVDADDLDGRFRSIGMWADEHDVARVHSNAMLLNAMMGMETSNKLFARVIPQSVHPQLTNPISILVMSMRILADRRRSIRTRAFEAITRTVVEMLVPSKRIKVNRTMSAQEIGGWMYKRGGTGWQKRWLKLSGNVLSWFLKDSSERPKGAMLVRNCRIVPSADGRAFEIIPSDKSEKSYSFQAPDKGEQMRWVSLLQMASLVGTKKAIQIDGDMSEKSTDESGKVGTHSELEGRLTRFYKKYNPSQIAKVTMLAEKYADRTTELFDALTQKYGPEPDPESSARRASIANSTNAAIAERFLSIMTALSSAINSDSCEMVQQERVVSEVAAACAKMGRVNDVVKEVVRTSSPLKCRDEWGGITRVCAVLAPFCEYLTLEKKETADDETASSKTNVHEDGDSQRDDEDVMPTETAVPNMLKILLSLTNRFDLQQIATPLQMWIQIAQPRNITKIVRFIAAVHKRSGSRILHEVMNAVFRTEPRLAVSTLVDLLQLCTTMTASQWEKNANVILQLMIPLTMIECKEFLPHLSSIVIHCIFLMKRDDSNENGTMRLDLEQFQQGTANVMLRNVIVALHSHLAACAAAAAKESEDFESTEIWARALDADDGCNELAALLSSPLYLINWEMAPHNAFSATNASSSLSSDTTRVSTGKGVGSKRGAELRDLTGLLRCLVGIFGYEHVVPNFYSELRAKALALGADSKYTLIERRMHDLYRALLRIGDTYSHPNSMADVRCMEQRLDKNISSLTDEIQALESSSKKNAIEAEQRERARRANALKSAKLCTSCEREHDSHSRLCERSDCANKFCVDCKKAHMVKIGYRQWICKSHQEQTTVSESERAVVEASESISKRVVSIETLMQSLYELIHHAVRLGRSSNEEAQIRVGIEALLQKVFWINVAILRIGDISNSSKRLTTLALRSLECICHSGYDRDATSRAPVAANAWGSRLLPSISDIGSFGGLLQLVARACVSSSATCCEGRNGILSRRVRSTLAAYSTHVSSKNTNDVISVSMITIPFEQMRWHYAQDASRDILLSSTNAESLATLLKQAGASSILCDASRRSRDDAYAREYAALLAAEVSGKRANATSFVAELLLQMLVCELRERDDPLFTNRLQTIALEMTRGYISSSAFATTELFHFSVVFDIAQCLAVHEHKMTGTESPRLLSTISGRKMAATDLVRTVVCITATSRVPFEAKLLRRVCNPHESISKALADQDSTLRPQSVTAASLIKSESYYWANIRDGFRLLADDKAASEAAVAARDLSSSKCRVYKEEEKRELEEIEKSRAMSVASSRSAESGVAAAEKIAEKEDDDSSETLTLPVSVAPTVRRRMSSLGVSSDAVSEDADVETKHKVVVMDFDFDADGADAEQLSCSKGDSLYLLEAFDDGWSQVRRVNDGKVGIVPSDYYITADMQA